MAGRKIVHIDMDAFYASVEQRDNPELRDKPVVVAWRGNRSVVCAASYEARKFGVRSAMPAVRAERLCPNAVFLAPDFPRYRAVSSQVREIFKRHTDLVEPLSLDEAYLDVTENKTGLSTATQVARTIRADIRTELQLTASAGVAPNKFLAKIASDWKKPNGLFVIQPEEVDSFLFPLPVGRVPGVGKVTEEKLKTLGIQTIGELRRLELAVLENRFGRYGARLYDLARGIDNSRVVPDRPTQSISSEDTFEQDAMARKRYQKGQLWLEQGNWHGRWREDVIVNGVRERLRRHGIIGTLKDYPTKRLAQRALDAHIEHVNKISYRPMPTAKFADFAQNWESKVLSQYGDSTSINYRTHIWKHLVPFLGEYSMKDLNPEMIQQFVSASAVSAKTTKNICITLQSMWTTAKAWGYVAHDIMEGVVLPEVKRVQRFFFSQREIQLILAKAQEPQRTWYGLAAETGLRAGELCGLTVDDIDTERGMLQVRQSAWRGKLGDPKTDDSIRVVELSPQACAHLRTFLKSWHPNQRRLLFATRNGTPWDQNLLLSRKFRPLLRSLGIQVPRGNGFHAFRHANATLMNSFGASQKLRQQRLGHAEGSPVTETIYTHVISEDGKRIAAQLGKAIWGVLDPSWTLKENGSGVEAPKPLYLN